MNTGGIIYTVVDTHKGVSSLNLIGSMDFMESMGFLGLADDALQLMGADGFADHGVAGYREGELSWELRSHWLLPTVQHN